MITIFVVPADTDVSEKITTTSLTVVSDVIKYLEPLAPHQGVVKAPSEYYYPQAIKLTGISTPFIRFLSELGYTILIVGTSLQGFNSITPDNLDNILSSQPALDKRSTATNNKPDSVTKPVGEKMEEVAKGRRAYTPSNEQKAATADNARIVAAQTSPDAATDAASKQADNSNTKSEGRQKKDGELTFADLLADTYT